MISENDVICAKEFSKSLLKDYYSGFTLRHTANMIKILQQIQSSHKDFMKDIDINLLLFSIYLHDIGRPVDEKNHAQVSYDIVSKKFKTLAEEDCLLIQDCICNHSTDGCPESKTAKLIQDIDKISMMQKEIFLEYIYHLAKETTQADFAHKLIHQIKKIKNFKYNFSFMEDYARSEEQHLVSLLVYAEALVKELG